MTQIFLLAYAAVVLTAACQVLLKLGAVRSRDKSLIHLYLNVFTVSGYAGLLIVTLINLYVYRYLDLKYAVIILPPTFILVALFSFWLFKEKPTKNQLIGSVLIIMGIIIFNLK